jgi:ParB-like chromosome segregation protein Spo0J
MRLAAAETIVAAAPARWGKAGPARKPQTPRVVELLRKAIEWREQLNSGEALSQADIARREGVTRARVTQVMGILRLAPEIRQRILAMPDVPGRQPVTERTLRPIAQIDDQNQQIAEFECLVLGS